MAPSYICPCCFLNRVSILRKTPDASQEFLNNYEENFTQIDHTKNTDINVSSKKIKDTNSFSCSHNQEINVNINPNYSDISTTITDSTISAGVIDSGNISGDSLYFMFPERLVSKNNQAKSSNPFIIRGNIGDQNVNNRNKQLVSTTTVNSLNKNEVIVEQIDCILKEQKKFLEDFNLPIYDEEGFKLKLDNSITLLYENRGDSVKHKKKQSFKSIKHKKKSNKKVKTCNSSTDQIILFASGDQNNMVMPRKENMTSNNNSVIRNDKPTIHGVDLYEEPVKLAKTFEWPQQTELDSNKNYGNEKNTSVKMLFFPENKLHRSLSSLISNSDSKSVTSTSVYVTAANSCTNTYSELLNQLGRPVYTMADSNSTMSFGNYPSLSNILAHDHF